VTLIGVSLAAAFGLENVLDGYQDGYAAAAEKFSTEIGLNTATVIVTMLAGFWCAAHGAAHLMDARNRKAYAV
jgi:hypothetical protein